MFPAELTPDYRGYRTGASTSADLYRLLNLPANCSCAGFNTLRSALSLDPTAATGTCICRGDGTPVIPVPRKLLDTPRIPTNCTTRRLNQSAKNISNCATACCRTFT